MDKTFFAIYNNSIIEVTHIRRKWWRNIHNYCNLLIAERNIFDSAVEAERVLLERQKVKDAKQKRIRAEYEADELQRDEIFKNNPWLLETDMPLAFLDASQLDEFVKKYKPKCKK